MAKRRSRWSLDKDKLVLLNWDDFDIGGGVATFSVGPVMAKGRFRWSLDKYKLVLLNWDDFVIGGGVATFSVGQGSISKLRFGTCLSRLRR